jgi:hypothetical protein
VQLQPAGDGEEAWLTATARGGVELFRESRDREREPRVRVRESPARLRESSDLTATSVGDWEWRHDGGTLAAAGSGLRPTGFKTSVQVTQGGGL